MANTIRENRWSFRFVVEVLANAVRHKKEIRSLKTEKKEIKLLSIYSEIVVVQSLSHVQVLATPWNSVRQASLSITNSQSFSNSCPSSQWCHPTISSSVIPFSSCLQPFLASGSFPMSQIASAGQSVGASALASVLPMNSQGWFPLGLTGLISLQSKGLSGVFSNATVQNHQFFGAQLSLWFNSHTHTWLLEKQ